MPEIEMHEASKEFAECWQAAGIHIQKIAQGPIQRWLHAHLHPPFLEHLSFRLGNQLFFIRIEDADGRLQVPGNRTGLLTVAEGCRGYACLMPMRKQNGQWKPVEAGWGLLDAQSDKPVDPASLITDAKIEMTDWELQDFAVQVVRDNIGDMGYQLMSWQNNPSFDPSIWYVGDSGPEWVVVRAARYPELEARPPENLEKIRANCAHLSEVGHFASVGIASTEEEFDPDGDIPPTPLWRGYGMHVRYHGLTSV